MNATNTIIITKLGLIETEISKIAQIIQSSTPPEEAIKLITLKKFDRILIICESYSTSGTLYELFSKNYKVYYSIKDNFLSTEEFLTIPTDQGQRFLISPPQSPQSEWTSREEEGPNTKSIYSPEELSDLLFKRFEPEKLVEYNDEQAVHLESEILLDNINGNPIIVLEPVNDAPSSISVNGLKTELPPTWS